MSFLTVSSSVHVSLLRRGVSPVLGPVGTLGGVAVAPPISLYTGPGWSPPFCRVPLVLRSVFSVTVRHSARIHGDHLVSFTDSCVSLARHPRIGLFLGHLRGGDWLDLLSSSALCLDSCHLRCLLVTTVRSSYRLR